MNDDDKKHRDQFDASLPLPFNDAQKNKKADPGSGSNAAAELIRQKLEAIYGEEPSARAEVQDLDKAVNDNLSKHQKFIMELTGSGKPLHEIQIAWHEYYAALPDREKHAVWQEFYKAHQEASHHQTAAIDGSGTEPHHHVARPRARGSVARTISTFQNPPKSADRYKAHSPLRSLIFGLGVGCMVLVIFLFSFFNERFIAPFIQPSRNVSGTPIISSIQTIGPDPEVIIPKINVQIPVVYTVNTIDDTAVENALEGGVVHYADTAVPGQNGNVVIVGHSSNNIFNPGKYKFAFVLLSRLDNGDTFYLDKDGKRYTYEVYKKQIVSPTDISVLGNADKPATASLITCDPPGTSNNRLVVTGEQIDPNPVANTAQTSNNKLAQEAQIIPGNSPSLWSRFVKWFWN